MRSPTLPWGSTVAVPPRNVLCCSAQSSRERVVPVQLERVLQASLASCAAVALVIGPAGAISGGKQSMGIFKPLDDADLSGVALTYAVPMLCPLTCYKSNLPSPSSSNMASTNKCASKHGNELDLRLRGMCTIPQDIVLHSDPCLNSCLYNSLAYMMHHATACTTL